MNSRENASSFRDGVRRSCRPIIISRISILYGVGQLSCCLHSLRRIADRNGTTEFFFFFFLLGKTAYWRRRHLKSVSWSLTMWSTLYIYRENTQPGHFFFFFLVRIGIYFVFVSMGQIPVIQVFHHKSLRFFDSRRPYNVCHFDYDFFSWWLASFDFRTDVGHHLPASTKKSTTAMGVSHLQSL